MVLEGQSEKWLPGTVAPTCLEWAMSVRASSSRYFFRLLPARLTEVYFGRGLGRLGGLEVGLVVKAEDAGGDQGEEPAPSLICPGTSLDNPCLASDGFFHLDRLGLGLAGLFEFLELGLGRGERGLAVRGLGFFVEGAVQ